MQPNEGSSLGEAPVRSELFKVGGNPIEYVKINSLWKRQDFVKGQPKGTHGPLIEGEYAEPEFGNVRKWSVEEKVDGTNIRIFFKCVNGQRTQPSIMGRTDAAQLPCHLLNYLQTLATWENFDKCFNTPNEFTSFEAHLFGEGYGPKIQACGGNYRKDVGFILFDVMMGRWWLRREDVQIIADKLAVPMVPQLGVMTEEEIIEFVKSKPLSRCSLTPQMMEGVVCRSEPLTLFRSGKPLMFKLKCKEFV
jgi:hypothetical protein